MRRTLRVAVVTVGCAVLVLAPASAAFSAPKQRPDPARRHRRLRAGWHVRLRGQLGERAGNHLEPGVRDPQRRSAGALPPREPRPDLHLAVRHLHLGRLEGDRARSGQLHHHGKPRRVPRGNADRHCHRHDRLDRLNNERAVEGSEGSSPDPRHLPQVAPQTRRIYPNTRFAASKIALSRFYAMLGVS
jgi:hypothetical protein